MSAMVDLRTMAAVLLTLIAARVGLGREFPFATHNLAALLTDVTLLAGYLYLARSLFRLPFAAVITFRRARQARRRYGLDRRESLRDGFVRGFLDRRRWTVGQLALLDRLALLVFTFYVTTPRLGVFLLKIGGLIGICLMLVIYLANGTFALLLDDPAERRPAGISLPFLDVHDR